MARNKQVFSMWQEEDWVTPPQAVRALKDHVANLDKQIEELEPRPFSMDLPNPEGIARLTAAANALELALDILEHTRWKD